MVWWDEKQTKLIGETVMTDDRKNNDNNGGGEVVVVGGGKGNVVIRKGRGTEKEGGVKGG